MSLIDKNFPLDTERDFWDYLRGGTTLCRKRRENLNKIFARVFPQGHRTSLRNFVSFAEYGVKYNKFRGAEKEFFELLDDIHPDVFQLLYKYGVDYTPVKWLRPPLE